MSPPPRSGLCLRGPCYQFDWDEAENQGGGEHSRQNHDFLHAEARHIHAGSVWHATDILGTLLRQEKVGFRVIRPHDEGCLSHCVIREQRR